MDGIKNQNCSNTSVCIDQDQNTFGKPNSHRTVVSEMFHLRAQHFDTTCEKQTVARGYMENMLASSANI